TNSYSLSTRAYTYKGGDVNVPASNIISEACKKRIPKMKHFRVDTSHASKASPWFRFPYPLQWGMPIFHWKTALVMCVVSIVASVYSVGSYHASFLLVASKPPTPGVASRVIGLQGICNILAGLGYNNWLNNTYRKCAHHCCDQSKKLKINGASGIHLNTLVPCG
ncbi:hypothetical protein MKW98_018420, partial [Papaver atlanticum]